MNNPNVTITLDWHAARSWDRIICTMLNQADNQRDPEVHGFLLTTHHALADAIINKTCTHCGTRPTRRSSRLCDACNTYHRTYGTLPRHDTLDRRDKTNDS